MFLMSVIYGVNYHLQIFNWGLRVMVVNLTGHSFRSFSFFVVCLTFPLLFPLELLGVDFDVVVHGPWFYCVSVLLNLSHPNDVLVCSVVLSVL